MRAWLRRWCWPIGKLLLALAIVLAVGRRFYLDLQNLDTENLSLRPGWLALSAILYVLALGFSAWFWYRLMVVFGAKPGGLGVVRAYYIGHLGKYVPGKAWSVLLRSALILPYGVRLGVAAITGFYEVLTTMAAGALLAAAIFLFQPPEVPGLSWNPVFTGLLLLVLLGLPLLPGVFNRLISRLAARFQRVESFRLPPLRHATLASGLLATSCGWILLGVSLWAMLQAVLPDPPDLNVSHLAHLIASLGLAYVAGFLAIVVPGGIGVREIFLLELLGQHGSNGAIYAMAILILRLVWTASELIVAAIVYWFPRPLAKTPPTREEIEN
ncbi:MAG TPA: lysylphosphatidylglycerol synthase domain-containing protein [Gemmataceae bacterium]|nr:lysylphosphatidylglycerol synthase domain-containing protein [Gemmataceae bacterium]